MTPINNISSQLTNKYFIFKNFFIKNKFILFITAILAVFTLFTSCADDDDLSQTGTNLSVSDIAGNWTATQATFKGVDLLADGGTIILVIQNNGRFTFTMKLPGEPDDISTGKLGFDGEWLAVVFDDDPGEEASFFISLVNNIMTLRGETEIDLDGNGIDEFGILNLIMKRT